MTDLHIAQTPAPQHNGLGVLPDLLGEIKFPRREWIEIVRAVAAKNQVTPQAIVGPSAKRAAAYARHEACYRIYCETKLSWPQIGGRLGERDHTTVMAGAKAHAKRNGLPAPSKH